MEADITERLPTPDEYNELREMVGWGTYAGEVIAQALPNSLYCVCASIDNKAVGMARVIGDGGLTYYILDVIVTPELMSARGKESFYQRYGFVQRPNDRLGCGMTIFWSDGM